MKVKHTLLLTALSVALAACSGGGGSGSSAGNNNTGSQPNKIKHEKVEHKKDKVTGVSFSGNNTFSFTSYERNNDINKLEISGKDIPLVEANMVRNNGWLTDRSLNTSGGTTRMIGDNLTNARYGFVIDQTARKAVLFAHGKETNVANVPTSGSARYEGQHVIEVDNKSNVFSNTKYYLATGKATLDVNFSDKTVAGELEVPSNGGKSTDSLPFNAKINGNKFSNEGSLTLKTVHVSGGFYGKNAEEVAGVYNNFNSFGGAFGAKKVASK